MGGWEINTIHTANTGAPINVWYTASAANDVTGLSNDFRGKSIQRPNLVGDPTGPDGAARLDHYFNAAAFAIPSASAPFGNLGRNAFRGPNFWQWDLGVNKNFRIREGVALQFRSEFFNLLNHTNFGQPSANVSDAAFGSIRTTFAPRQIQFALKALF